MKFVKLFQTCQFWSKYYISVRVEYIAYDIIEWQQTSITSKSSFILFNKMVQVLLLCVLYPFLCKYQIFVCDALNHYNSDRNS
jgi:hypothetical protein